MLLLPILVQLLFALQLLVAVNAVATPRHPSPAETFPHARAAQSASTRQGEARVPQAQPRTRGGWGLTQEDEETGLCYNRYRYYDPELGRFVSSDPVGLRGGFNVFVYAPNVHKWIDPLGLTRDCSGGEAAPEDTLVRRGTSPESATRLARQAEAAENAGVAQNGVPYGHGVSVSTPEANARLSRDPSDASMATREAFENAGFPVRHTPTRADPTHHTVQLPKPVTPEVAERFNSVLGRL